MTVGHRVDKTDIEIETVPFEWRAGDDSRGLGATFTDVKNRVRVAEGQQKKLDTFGANCK